MNRTIMIPGMPTYRKYPYLFGSGDAPGLVWTGWTQNRVDGFPVQYHGSYERTRVTWYCKECFRSWGSETDARACYMNHNGTVGALIARLQELPPDWLVAGNYSKSRYTQYGIGVYAADGSGITASVPTTVDGGIKRYRLKGGKRHAIKEKL